jgi:hypothetical protein
MVSPIAASAKPAAIRRGWNHLLPRLDSPVLFPGLCAAEALGFPAVQLAVERPADACEHIRKCHSGARALPASPEAKNTGFGNHENAPVLMVSGPAPSGHPGMTTVVSSRPMPPIRAGFSPVRRTGGLRLMDRDAWYDRGFREGEAGGVAVPADCFTTLDRVLPGFTSAGVRDELNTSMREGGVLPNQGASETR